MTFAACVITMSDDYSGLVAYPPRRWQPLEEGHCS